MTGPLRQNEKGEYEVVYRTCQQCGGQYAIRESHLQSARHRQWLKGELEVPVPPQPDAVAYEKKPERLVFGEAVLCPRCHGRFPSQSKKDKAAGKPPPERFTREIGKPHLPCARCKGVGYVPNVAV